MTRILAIVTLLGTVFVAGCETTEGFGRDVQSAGSALEEESVEQQLEE